jgi:hypothetical protein
MMNRYKIVLLNLILLTPTVFTAELPSCPALGSGLKYTHERSGNEPLSIHILQIDRAGSEFEFITTLAQNTIFGLRTVGEQTNSVPPALGKPLAAVNGDFFIIKPGPYQGDPCGLHICGGELVSGPAGPAFWIDPAGRPNIDTVQPDFQILWPNGSPEKTPFTLNEQRNDNQATLYTPILGPSTRTTGGIELILEPVDQTQWLPLRPNRTYRARIKTIVQNGNNPLHHEIMILSIGPVLAGKIPPLKPGDILTLSTRLIPILTNVKTALGGHPILLKHSKPCPLPDTPLATLRHPRTALGWNSRFYYWCVVDGRAPNLSRGMTLKELADLMLRLGCTDAINLDGGGSATFWLTGRVLNSPSDHHERPIANALILLRKSPPRTTASSNTQPSN